MADNSEFDKETKRYNGEKDCIDYFLGLKKNYAEQRKPWEDKWDQALSSVFMLEDLEKTYEGRANVQSPIQNWKVSGITSRIARILFNRSPIGRIEDKKVSQVKRDVVDLWNKYIFEHQLDEINFKDNFKVNLINKAIYGTSVAKITQEYEEKEIDFFDEDEVEPTVIKDNTYYRPILLKEFYSDINKMDINESQACIQSTVVSFEQLKALEYKKVKNDVIDEETGVFIDQEEEEEGIYKNLELLESFGDNLTSEQREYLDMLGFNKGQVQTFEKALKKQNKTGFIEIDECYGIYPINGIPQEVVCTIAAGTVVIRLEPTPFKHKRYVRPFIVGRYKKIPNVLYGTSPVILGHNLLLELNASRAQATDAKTRSIAPMWYEDTSKSVVWDKVWRPNGIIKGVGPNGMQPILNPYLGNVAINDSTLIQRDLDQLWGLSPVQEGTSDSSMIPGTKGATLAVIGQNDLPLNDLIDDTIEFELKPFIEVLYERNLVYKTVDDLMVVWTEDEIKSAGLESAEMKDLLLNFNIKILGTLELNNELAHQQGYTALMQIAPTIPPIAKRIDWQVLTDKLLRSYGIKDDSDGIFYSDEIMAQVAQEEAMQQQQMAQAQQQQKAEGIMVEAEMYKKKKEVDTESEIVKMQAEAATELSTGQKI